MSWWAWLLVGIAIWIALGFLVGVLVGGMIGYEERRRDD